MYACMVRLLMIALILGLLFFIIGVGCAMWFAGVDGIPPADLSIPELTSASFPPLPHRDTAIRCLFFSEETQRVRFWENETYDHCRTEGIYSLSECYISLSADTVTLSERKIYWRHPGLPCPNPWENDHGAFWERDGMTSASFVYASFERPDTVFCVNEYMTPGTNGWLVRNDWTHRYRYNPVTGDTVPLTSREIAESVGEIIIPDSTLDVYEFSREALGGPYPLGSLCDLRDTHRVLFRDENYLGIRSYVSKPDRLLTESILVYDRKKSRWMRFSVGSGTEIMLYSQGMLISTFGTSRGKFLQLTDFKTPDQLFFNCGDYRIIGLCEPYWLVTQPNRLLVLKRNGHSFKRIGDFLYEFAEEIRFGRLQFVPKALY